MFKASPFLVGDDCVSIMNGTDEGRVARASGPLGALGSLGVRHTDGED